jgi:hypothetical protein
MRTDSSISKPSASLAEHISLASDDEPETCVEAE